MISINIKYMSPTPYIVVFVILFIVALVATTWALDRFYKYHQCVLYPDIWCSDSWTCQNSCPDGMSTTNPSVPVNSCFKNVGPNGLASCLFGPKSVIANTCYGPNTKDGPLCPCPENIDAITTSCLAGCGRNLNGVNKNPACSQQGACATGGG